MRVRIVKLKDNLFVLQCINHRGSWEGLEVKYRHRFSSVVYAWSTWISVEDQAEFCSFKSEGKAMKALLNFLKFYTKEVQNKNLLETLKDNKAEVVYEIEV